MPDGLIDEAAAIGSRSCNGSNCNWVSFSENQSLR